MSTYDKFCLKWNDFQQNTQNSFYDMREDLDFSDVTLACNDGNKIEAHKVILAASSPVFKDILKQNKNPYPLVYMKGMKAIDLGFILDYIYYGEVKIYQNNLDNFLIIANDLELKGLTDGKKLEEVSETENISISNQFFSSPIKGEKELNEARVMQKNIIASQSNINVKMRELNKSEDNNKLVSNKNFSEQLKTDEVTNITDRTESQMIHDDVNAYLLSQPHISPQRREMATEFNRQIAEQDNVVVNVTNEDLEEKIESMIEKSDGVWTCNACGKTNEVKAMLKRHIESRHTIGASHICNICGKSSKTFHSLRVHKGTHR